MTDTITNLELRLDAAKKEVSRLEDLLVAARERDRIENARYIVLDGILFTRRDTQWTAKDDTDTDVKFTVALSGNGAKTALINGQILLPIMWRGVEPISEDNVERIKELYATHQRELTNKDLGLK